MRQMNLHIHQGTCIGTMVAGASMQCFESMCQHQWHLLFLLNGCASWFGASVWKCGYFGNFFEILIILEINLKNVVILKNIYHVLDKHFLIYSIYVPQIINYFVKNINLKLLYNCNAILITFFLTYFLSFFFII